MMKIVVISVLLIITMVPPVSEMICNIPVNSITCADGYWDAFSDGGSIPPASNLTHCMIID